MRLMHISLASRSPTAPRRRSGCFVGTSVEWGGGEDGGEGSEHGGDNVTAKMAIY